MNHFAQILYQALATPRGLVVLHENPSSAQVQFNLARRAQGDPALRAIRIVRLKSHPNRLYLVHDPALRAVHDPDPKESPPCPETTTPNHPSDSTSGCSSLTLNGSARPTPTTSA